MKTRAILSVAALAVTTGFAFGQQPGRAARLLRPIADPQPAMVEPLPVAVNPAAPPGFNAPVPVYPMETAGPGAFWARGEWLYWATSGQPLPALATGAPATTDRSLAGTLGSPNTTVLYGDGKDNKDFRNGFRFSAGWWFDDDRTRGIEGDFFFLQNSRGGFSAASDGSSIISRPFVNAQTGLQDVELVSYPGVVAGSLIADPRNSVIGGGVSYVHNLCGDPCSCRRWDLLLGYRYWNVTDSLSITENLTALPGQTTVPPGTTFVINDRFRTSNNFHGGLIGISAERNRGRYFVAGRASVALGANVQETTIDGSTTITTPGGVPTTYAGGLLAQTTSMGHYTRTVFAVVPEVGIRAGANVTDHVRVYVGYNFLYLSNVQRAGDQIDPRVNTSLLPPGGTFAGPALPNYTPKTTDFWAQGISIGMEVRY
jgi:hypothetical protein